MDKAKFYISIFSVICLLITSNLLAQQRSSLFTGEEIQGRVKMVTTQNYLIHNGWPHSKSVEKKPIETNIQKFNKAGKTTELIFLHKFDRERLDTTSHEYYVRNEKKHLLMTKRYYYGPNSIINDSTVNVVNLDSLKHPVQGKRQKNGYSKYEKKDTQGNYQLENYYKGDTLFSVTERQYEYYK